MKQAFLKIFNVTFFVFILVFYLVYSTVAVDILKKFNIDIKSLSVTKQSIILILIELSLLLILCFIYRKDLKKEFKIFKNSFGKIILFSILCWLIGLALMAASNLILHFLFHSSPVNENHVQKLLTTMPVYIAITSCIFAPFMEELVFRKSLKKCFTNPYLFIIVSGLLFGFLHVMASKNIYEFLYIIPYGLFGSVFAYVYYKTKTIFSSITIHMIHNTILVILSLIGLGVI